MRVPAQSCLIALLTLAIEVSTDPYRSGAHSILDSTVDKLKAKLETLTLAERTAYISQQMAANTQWREVC